MNDTIRWCFTHKRQDTVDHKMWASYNHAMCEVAPALVIRAGQPVYRLIPCSEVDTPPENALLIRPTGMLEDDQWLVRLGEEEQ